MDSLLCRALTTCGEAAGRLPVGETADSQAALRREAGAYFNFKKFFKICRPFSVRMLSG
jgi:hypothetical protein